MVDTSTVFDGSGSNILSLPVKTILVLEDESALMTLMRHILKAHALIQAATAEEAIRLFSEHGRPVHLLIADVTLPKSSGIQVALLLRLEDPDLPVLLTSGYPVSDWIGRDYSDLQRLGSSSVAFLSKPFQTDRLLKAVRQLIEAEPSEKVSTA